MRKYCLALSILIGFGLDYFSGFKQHPPNIGLGVAFLSRIYDGYKRRVSVTRFCNTGVRHRYTKKYTYVTFVVDVKIMQLKIKHEWSPPMNDDPLNVLSRVKQQGVVTKMYSHQREVWHLGIVRISILANRTDASVQYLNFQLAFHHLFFIVLHLKFYRR